MLIRWYNRNLFWELILSLI
uniref:Uncharacterized protein n=1 Tax=Arundo donax TaxID=35708 RepID=A0A0A8YU18_ARUDO